MIIRHHTFHPTSKPMEKLPTALSPAEKALLITSVMTLVFAVFALLDTFF